MSVIFVVFFCVLSCFDTVSIVYRYNIDTVSIQYRYCIDWIGSNQACNLEHNSWPINVVFFVFCHSNSLVPYDFDPALLKAAPFPSTGPNESHHNSWGLRVPKFPPKLFPRNSPKLQISEKNAEIEISLFQFFEISQFSTEMIPELFPEMNSRAFKNFFENLRIFKERLRTL